MRFRAGAVLGAALSLAAAVPATAQVVVDGGAPDGGAGWNIFDDNRAAANFSIGGVTSFDAIRFWGILPDGPVYTPTMYWQILNDDGGGPGTTIVAEGNAPTSATLRTELSGSGFASWQFDFGTGPQSLAGGVYWLALHDGPLDPSAVTGSTLIWETSDPPGQYAIQTFSVDDHWDVIPDNGLAFQLRNDPIASPEPASVVLCATGLLVVVGMRMRKRV